MYSIKKFSKMNESLTTLSIFNEYEEEKNNFEEKYKSKFLRISISLLDKWREYGDREYISNDYAIFDLEENGEDWIEIGEGSIQYIQYKGGIWVVSGENYDSRSNTIEIKSNLSDLNSLDLSKILKRLLGINEIVKYYSVDAIKKINRN